VPVTSPATRRRGGTLVELLVALPLAALVAVLAAATLIGGWRLNRRVAATQGSAREFRHAQATFEAELRPLRARDIHAVSDTALEFDALLGVGVICAATGTDSIAATIVAINCFFIFAPQLYYFYRCWYTII
jgi:type II secretory pathway pseudopilin PulG